MENQTFEAFYKNYHKLLLKRALLIVDDLAVSEDIIHDVFLKLMAKPHRWHAIENKQAYLVRAVSNHAINYWKADHKFSVLEESDLSADVLHISEEEEDLTLIRKKIKFHLSQLPPKQQLVFKLSRYEGLDHEEIADFLQISKNTVKNQLVSALSHMRKNIPIAWLLITDYISL